MVTAFMVLHHVAVPLEMVKEVYRVLKPGGYFVIREHSVKRNSEAIFLDIVHGLYDQSWSNPKQDPEFLQNHWAQYYSHTQWDDIICSVGFETAKYYSDLPHILRYFYAAYKKPDDTKKTPSNYVKKRKDYKNTQSEKSSDDDEKRGNIHDQVNHGSKSHPKRPKNQ